ncbi:DNA sulfur modification protein DndB [Bailinhaonella thermotolerans]|uniref:DNA sulfur modification protein DndB n=1 Tax=Bailinhaonella thermotolerans TaxID=1070861 RepID=UPI00192A5C34|nr:DNA sulfur modification protein DndB [Bailinhaonella thermotolerans]
MTATSTDVEQLRAKLKGKRPIRFERIAFMSRAGKLDKLTWSEPMPALAELWNFESLLQRNDYDLDDTSRPGQRDVYESHIKKIAEGIRTSDRPYLGTLVIGMDRNREFVEIEEIQELATGVTLVKITVYEGAPVAWSVDGQHREISLSRVWALVRDAVEGDELVVREYLEQSSVEMTLLLEGDPDILSTLFIKMASTKPISPSLIAVMDKGSMQNRLGQYVIKNAALFQGRITYLANASHKKRAGRNGSKFEGLYPASAVRSAAAAIAGVGVRDRTPDAREEHLNEVIKQRTTEKGISGEEALVEIGTEIVELLDYALRNIPGWREINDSTLTVTEFRENYLHSAAAGLHVIANTIAAARMAGVSPHKAIDALAELPWRRDAFKTSDDDDKAMTHKFFEGTLAKTTWDLRGLRWRAGASGATRSNYEAAISNVLTHVTQKHPELSALGTDETFTKLGLIARKRGRGRPKKIATAAQ